jgi:hypothetical protein
MMLPIPTPSSAGRVCSLPGLRRRSRRGAGLLLIVLLAVACGPKVQSARFGETPAPRPGTQPIQVFSTKLPECPFEELALVRVEKRHGFTSLQAMLDAMRHRAREMGGDAIVGVGHTSSVEAGVASGTATTTDGIAGTVIRFTDAACMRE